MKRDRPNQIRKRLIKKKDQAFQTLPEDARCMVPNCPNKPGRHHRIKRRRTEFRWDERYAMELCWEPHHREVEDMGEKAFCEKYGIQLTVGLPAKFQ